MIPPPTRRFVAGETAGESLDHVTSLDRRGIGGILNLLGEHYSTRDAAEEDVSEYLGLVSRIGRTGVAASSSVKPSQIGIDAGDGVFEDDLGRIVEAGDENDVFVRVDMEDHTTTDVTLDAYTRLTSNTEVVSDSVCKRTSDERTMTSNDSRTFPVANSRVGATGPDTRTRTSVGCRVVPTTETTTPRTARSRRGMVVLGATPMDGFEAAQNPNIGTNRNVR